MLLNTFSSFEKYCAWSPVVSKDWQRIINNIGYLEYLPSNHVDGLLYSTGISPYLVAMRCTVYSLN
jgi:hypothetical protein